MELKLEIFSALCATSKFTINGIEADYGDFGEKYDNDPSNAEDYGCGDMKFFPTSPPLPMTLVKYKINEEDYKLICEQLEEKLSFGSCGWCI